MFGKENNFNNWDFLIAWEQIHGTLTDSLRERFLNDKRVNKILIFSKKEVLDSLRESQYLDDILEDLKTKRITNNEYASITPEELDIVDTPEDEYYYGDTTFRELMELAIDPELLEPEPWEREPK